MALRSVLLGYGRRSEVRNATDEINVERQHSRLEAEATRRGWMLEWYEDAEGHKSGRSEQGRPGWLTLRVQLDRPDVVGIGVESLSRATRSVRDLYNLLHELEGREKLLLSLKEQIDTSSAMGRAFVGFVAIMNQLESDLASERMAANIEYKRVEKGRHWGRTPFGCQREGDDHILVPSKEGATVDGVWRGYHEALQKCYEWFAQGGMGFSELADRLNDSGYRYRDRHGKPRRFNEQDVRRMIHSHPIYAGGVVLGAAKSHPTAVIKGSHQPILPLELCRAVADQLAARQIYGPKFHGHSTPDRTYLLSDILYCAQCGAKLVGGFQDNAQWYRHDGKKGCTVKGWVKAVLLEAQVMDRLSQFALPDQLKERIRALARKLVSNEAQPDWQQARATLQRLARKLDTLKELRIEGEIDKKEYDRRKVEIEAQQRDAQDKLRHAPTDVRDLEDLLNKIDEFAEVIREGTPQQKKKLFNALFERIETRDGEMTLLKPREWAKPFFNGGNGIANNLKS